MKHGKAPTKSQKIFLRSLNLDTEEWLIVKNTDILDSVSKYTEDFEQKFRISRRLPQDRLSPVEDS